MKRQIIALASVVALVSALAGCVSTQTATAWKEQRQQDLSAGSMIAQTAAGPIEYAVEGSGPVVLGLHGVMGGYDTGIALGKALMPTGVTVLSVSRPGYLRTPLSVGKTLPEEADAYAALLDTLGIQKVAVVGGSAGGPPAIEFALRHPDRCWGLVLISTVVESNGITKFTHAQKQSFSNSFGDRQSYQTVQMMHHFPRRVLSAMAPETARQIAGHPALIHLAIEFMNTSFPMSLREAGTMNDMESVTSISMDQFAQITVPTLFLNGDKDEWAPLDLVKNAAAHVPGAKLVVYPNGDHLFFITYLDQVRAELAKFIAQHEPR